MQDWMRKLRSSFNYKPTERVRNQLFLIQLASQSNLIITMNRRSIFHRRLTNAEVVRHKSRSPTLIIPYPSPGSPVPEEALEEHLRTVYSKIKQRVSGPAQDTLKTPDSGIPSELVGPFSSCTVDYSWGAKRKPNFYANANRDKLRSEQGRSKSVCKSTEKIYMTYDPDSRNPVLPQRNHEFYKKLNKYYKDSLNVDKPSLQSLLPNCTIGASALAQMSNVTDAKEHKTKPWRTKPQSRSRSKSTVRQRILNKRNSSPVSH